MHHFNVYSADRRWTWLTEFWSGNDYGIARVGDIILSRRGQRYNRLVWIKRMS